MKTISKSKDKLRKKTCRMNKRKVKYCKWKKNSILKILLKKKLTKRLNNGIRKKNLHRNRNQNLFNRFKLIRRFSIHELLMKSIFEIILK